MFTEVHARDMKQRQGKEDTEQDEETESEKWPGRTAIDEQQR